jgi:hypothetical protein
MLSNLALRLTPQYPESRFPATRMAGAVRLAAITLLLGSLSMVTACGSGSAGESDGAIDAGATGTTQPSGGTATPGTSGIPTGAAFFCDFSGSWQDCQFHEQAKVAGRATLVTVAGVNAVRLHTEPGDDNVTGSGSHERNDLTTSQATSDGYEGRDHWWAHSVLFPNDYVDPPESTGSSWNFGGVANFHNTTNGAGQANFQVITMPATAISPDRPTGLNFQINHGSSQTSPTQVTYPIGPIVRNQWYNFVYHVKWSSGPDGFFDAWVNGVQKMSYRGPTLYAGQGVYFKLANYHTAFGQASSVIHTRVIRSVAPLSVSDGL